VPHSWPLDRYGTTPAARVHLIRLGPDFGLETAAQDLRRPSWVTMTAGAVFCGNLFSWPHCLPK